MNHYFLFVFVAFGFCLVLLIDTGVSNHFNLNFSFSKNLVGIQKAIIEPAGSRTPSNFPVVPMNPYIIPAGTQMAIPHWVLEQYQLSEQQALYGDVLNFLIYNYGVAAPSADDIDVDTYYIPLSVYDTDYSDYSNYDDYDAYYDDYDAYDDGVSIARGTVMVDVTKLTAQASGDSPSRVPPPDVQPPDVQPPEVQPSGTPPPSGDLPPDVQTGAPSLQPPPSSGDSPSGAQAPGVPPLQPKLGPESPGTEDAPPSDAQSGEIVLETTEDIDKRTIPVTKPKPRPVKDLTEPYPAATCDKAEEETEATGSCIDCVGLDKEQTSSFLDKVSANVQHADRNKDFSTIPAVFCRNCYGVDVNDFFQHIEQRAKEEKVPSAIMFAFMLRESNGDCNAGGDSKKSFGLFQLNTKNSTKLEPCASNELSGLNTQQMADVCKKGQYRKEGYPKAKGRCLNNPYCNLEEAIHLLNEKWNMTAVNRGIDKPTKTDWVEMGDKGRNLWRNTIIAYNGAGYLNSAEVRMGDGGLSSVLDNWEVKRMFFVKSYLYNKSKYELCGKTNSKKDKDCRAKYNPKNIIHNLAYVERVTGREMKDGLANSSMCQWLQFKNSNPALSCKK